jgi:hypothetical protein
MKQAQRNHSNQLASERFVTSYQNSFGVRPKTANAVSHHSKTRINLNKTEEEDHYLLSANNIRTPQKVI